MEKRLLSIIVILSLAGLAIAGYSFAHNRSFASGSFCTINASFNCDIVNKGPYSELFGVPVALIGVAGYLFLAAAAMMRQPSDSGLLGFLVLGSGGGFAFSGYLSGIEAFVLETWCLLCLTSQALIALIFASAVFLWFKRKKEV